MSLSNPIYGTLPAFDRAASGGSTVEGSGSGFMAPPPGASQGGEPGHYPPFVQSHPSPFDWPNPQLYHPQSQSYPPWGYAHSQQSHQSQPQPQHQSQHSQQVQFQPQPSHHSPYQPHASQQPQYQTQHSQQPEQRLPLISYGGYPPSPDFPGTAPATVSAFNYTPNTPNTPNAFASRYSPYGTQIPRPPPASAPAEVAPWSQHLHSHQQHPQQYVHQQHPQQEQHHRPQQHRRNSHSNPSPRHIPISDEPIRHNPPQPFRGSANAPHPKKPALRRSNSHSAGEYRPIASGSQPHTPQIQRHGSTGSGFGANIGTPSWLPTISPGMAPGVIPPTSIMPPSNVPGYTIPDEDVWNSDHLSPRPRDWRADYSPKQGFSSYLPKIGRVRSDVEEYIDTIRRHLHPLFHHSQDSDPLAFDLRYKLLEGHTLLLNQLGRQFSEVDLAQLAAYPPAPILRLYHARLPWYIDIHQSHPTGVTVFDVLAQLSLQVQAPIHNRHYYNEFLDSADRTALGRGYKERVRGRKGEGRKGILQVDFLGEKYVFGGLERGKQGMWEIKTRRPTDPSVAR